MTHRISTPRVAGGRPRESVGDLHPEPEPPAVELAGGRRVLDAKEDVEVLFSVLIEEQRQPARMGWGGQVVHGMM